MLQSLRAVLQWYAVLPELDAGFARGAERLATWMTNKCDDQYANLLHKVREVLPYDPYDPMADPNRMLPILDPTTAAFQNFAKTCPSAFVRMAGMALRQHSVLTVNNGRYYIDTTQSNAFQRNTPDLEPKRTRFVNVFEGGKVPNDKSATCKVAD